MSLSASYTFVGRGNWSLDATSGSHTDGGIVEARVPEGSTVEAAFLYASTYDHSLAPTHPAVDVTMESGGQVLQLDSSDFVEFDNATPTGYQDLVAFRADVTSFVEMIVDDGADSNFQFALSDIDGEFAAGVDGYALAVVYSNPTQDFRTITFADGSSAATGDNFTVSFDQPVDTAHAGFDAQLSLGIGFSLQNQYDTQDSQVVVNGQTLTSSAGGEDDGSTTNGGLITIGGLGDDSANPADPYLREYGDPRYDDEYYDLAANSVNGVPFIADGATEVVVETYNPSNNDNIFFAGFNFTCLASIDSAVNDAPVSVDDTCFVATETNAIILDVLGNDFDPDGDAISIVAIDGVPLTVGGVVSLASGALVGINGDGTVTYDPNGHINGLMGCNSVIDGFSYTIDDGMGLQATAQAAITVEGTSAAIPSFGDDIFVNTGSNEIGIVDIDGGTIQIIGPANSAQLTDIAFAPDGQLYGISFNGLYAVDQTTGAATQIGSTGQTLNALDFTPDGTLYAAGPNGDALFVVDPSTGAANEVARLGHASAGDLQFDPVSGKLYMTSVDAVIAIDIDNGYGVQPVVDLTGLSEDVFGLGIADHGGLIGFGASGGIYDLDPTTGQATLTYTSTESFFGAAASSHPGSCPGDETQTASSNTVTLPDGQEVAISATTETVTDDDTAELSGTLSLTGFLADDFNIAYVIDKSGSTSNRAYDDLGNALDLDLDGVEDRVLDVEQAAFAELNDQLEANGLGHADLAVISFDYSPLLQNTTQIGRDSDGNGVADGIDTINALHSGGGTNFENPLQEAIGFFSGQDDVATATNVIYFLSDGRASTTALADELATLSDANGIDAIINAIGAGSDADQEALDVIDNTGGARVVTNLSQLAAGLTASSLDIDDIVSVDIAVNGVVQQTLDSTAFTDTPTGPQFGPVLLTGLDPNAVNTVNIEADLVTNDGSIFELNLSTEIVGANSGVDIF